jgi:hypothetical protein
LPELEAMQDMMSGDPAVKGFGGVAYGNGTFVALGRGGGQDVFRYATSKDGETWTCTQREARQGTPRSSASRARERLAVFAGLDARALLLQQPHAIAELDARVAADHAVGVLGTSE